MKRFLLFTLFVVATIGMANAQGVTTSAINGVVKDTKGEVLPGASVMAVHTPTGTQYGMNKVVLIFLTFASGDLIH
jgi:hypothetical protein